MFGPYQIPHLIRYFDGIDLAVSNRLLRPVVPSETTLTEEFCALMDAVTQRREKTLAFDLDALSASLAEHGDQIDIQFRIDTHQHPSWMEAYVSQSDFALVLECRNTVLPEFNWHSAYLMQAKKLFPGVSGEYGIDSTFASIDTHQRRRIEDLVKILGDNALKYCFYCPPTSGYSKSASAAIRIFHTFNISNNIFDYAFGLALHNAILHSGGIENGIWISDTKSDISNAASLHIGALLNIHPLTWFLLQHLIGRNHDSQIHQTENLLLQMSSKYPISIWKAHQGRASTKIDRVRDIARCDINAIRELIDELGYEARKPDLVLENRKILPATTITIGIRIGPIEGVDFSESLKRKMT